MQVTLNINNANFEVSPVSGVTFLAKRPKIDKVSSISQYKHTVAKYGYAVERLKPIGIVSLDPAAWITLTTDLLFTIPNFELLNGVTNPFYTLEEYNMLNCYGSEPEWEKFREHAQTHCVIFLNKETKEWFAAIGSGYRYPREIAFPMTTTFVLDSRYEEPEEVEPVVNTETELSNKFCFITIRPGRKDFSGGDKTDRNNEPRFYNTTRRSFKKACAALREKFDASTTMYAAMNILEENGIRTRSYCAMD